MFLLISFCLSIDDPQIIGQNTGEFQFGSINEAANWFFTNFGIETNYIINLLGKTEYSSNVKSSFYQFGVLQGQASKLRRAFLNQFGLKVLKNANGYLIKGTIVKSEMPLQTYGIDPMVIERAKAYMRALRQTEAFINEQMNKLYIYQYDNLAGPLWRALTSDVITSIYYKLSGFTRPTFNRNLQQIL